MLDILGAAKRVAVPWLIAHGADDEAVSILEGKALYAASARPTTKLLEVEGAGHTFGAAHPWKGTTPQFEQVADASISHLAGALV